MLTHTERRKLAQIAGEWKPPAEIAERLIDDPKTGVGMHLYCPESNRFHFVDLSDLKPTPFDRNRLFRRLDNAAQALTGAGPAPAIYSIEQYRQRREPSPA